MANVESISAKFIITVDGKRKVEIVPSSGVTYEEALSKAWKRLFKRISNNYTNASKKAKTPVRDLSSIVLKSVESLDYIFGEE